VQVISAVAQIDHRLGVGRRLRHTQIGSNDSGVSAGTSLMERLLDTVAHSSSRWLQGVLIEDASTMNSVPLGMLAEVRSEKMAKAHRVFKRKSNSWFARTALQQGIQLRCSHRTLARCHAL
jgi:hypothetical protein